MLDHTYDNACDADCNSCGATRTPADHTYGDWKVTVEATKKNAGSQTRSCTVCGNSETEEIPATGKSGCGGFVALGIVACIVPAAIVICKKKD